MDILNNEIHEKTLRPVYKISYCSACKRCFIPKLKKWGDVYKTCENCRINQDIYRLKINV